MSNALVADFFNPGQPVPTPQKLYALPQPQQPAPPSRMPIESHISRHLTEHIKDQYEHVGKFLVELVMEKCIKDLLVCRSIYLGEAGDVMDTFCYRIFEGGLGRDRAEWNNMLESVLRLGIETNRKVLIFSPGGSQ